MSSRSSRTRDERPGSSAVIARAEGAEVVHADERGGRVPHALEVESSFTHQTYGLANAVRRVDT